MKRMTVILLVLAAATGAWAAAPKAATPDAAIVTANNRFATDLYGQIASEKGNLFFSPSSIHTALAMTYARLCGHILSPGSG